MPGGPRFRHLDDVSWEEVRKVDYGDHTASVREKWLDFSPRFLSLLAALCAVALTAGLRAAGPARIVSTSPSITETLFALGLGDRVVGGETIIARLKESYALPLGDAQVSAEQYAG